MQQSSFQAVLVNQKLKGYFSHLNFRHVVLKSVRFVKSYFLLGAVFIVSGSVLLETVSAQQNAGQTNKNKLPEIGVVASDAISLDKEKQVGDILMRQLRGQTPIVGDPILEEYIQDIGNRLVAQAENVKFPFKFFLISNSEINAFAFFGGHVGVHTGLIYNADNESELASVLAHEVSHVTQRHIARRIQAQQRSTPLQLASLFGGLLVAMANPEAGIAAISASTAAGQQASINFTRSNEKEADRVGMQIMAQSGFDPQGASTFFGKLAAKYRVRSKPPAFLLTHPLPESRIADARARANGFPNRAIPPNLNFHLVKSRIQARYYSNPKSNIVYYRDQLDKQNYVFKQAALYGLALSFFENEQYSGAEEVIDLLLKSDSENLFYIDTATDIAIAKKEFKKAIDMLQSHSQHTPHNRVLSLNLANVLIKSGEYEQAIQILKDYLLLNPDHFLTRQLLSEAFGESGNMLELHQNKAEIFVSLAAYDRAIDELHNAYNFASDSKLEKQRIRARIDQLREAINRMKSL